MYKDVKKQIAFQTRDKLGLVAINPSKGFSGRAMKDSVTIPGGGDQDNKPTIAWDRYFYQYRRAIYGTDANNKSYLISKDFAPTLDPNLVDEPTYGNGKFFNFWSYNGQIQHNKTNPNPLGNIREVNLPQDCNIAYGITLGSRSGQRSRQTIKIHFAGKSVNCSVFIKHKSISAAEHYEILYSTGGDFLTPFNPSIEETLNFTIGPYGTELWVVLYKHYEINAENIGSDNFVVDVDLSAFASDVQPITFNTNISPSYSAYGNFASSDPITGNTFIKLRMSKPNTTMWRGINIYQVVDTAPGVSINRMLPPISYLSCAALDTSNIRIFSSNDKLTLGSATYNVNQIYQLKANRTVNGDFSSISGHRAYWWPLTHSNPATVGFGRSTGYPYKVDRMYGYNNYYIYAEKTNTAKAIYIQSSAFIKVSDLAQPRLFFNYKLDTGVAVGAIAVLYYTSSNASSVCVPSNKTYSNLGFATSYSNLNNRYWREFSLRFTDRYDSSNPSFMPYNCKYIKVKFYGCHNSTSKAGYIVDGFTVSDSGGLNIFHTSQSDRSVISFSEVTENPRDPVYTNYNLYFRGTSLSWKTNDKFYRVYNRPMYIHSSYLPYNYGIAVVDSALNLLGNGDLSGGLSRFWVNNRCKIFYNTAQSCWGGLYHTAFYATLFGHGTAKATLSQKIGQATAGTNWKCGHSGFPFAVWIRSRTPGRAFNLKIDDLRGSSTQVAFTASSQWKQYTMYKKFNGTSATVRAWFVVDSGSPWMFDWAGAQLQGSKTAGVTQTQGYISAFNHLSTAQSSFRRNQGWLATASQKLDVRRHTIRMWYTPYLNYASGNSRVFFRNARGASYNMLWYDKPNSKFKFDNVHTTIAYSASITGVNFATSSRVYIAVSIASSYMTLYVNTSKSKALYFPTLSTTGAMSFACGLGTAFPACGVISNLRMDKYPWNSWEVAADRLSDHIHPDNTVTLSKTRYNYIGQVDNVGDDGKPYVEFVDDNALSPETIYKYTSAFVDVDKNVGPFASVVSIRTPRQSYEYYQINKILNGSFEYVQNRKALGGWATTVPTSRLTTAYSLFGSVACDFDGSNEALTYDYITIEDTTRPLHISYYTVKSTGSGYDYCDTMGVAFKNSVITDLGSRTYYGFMSTTAVLDSRNRRWVRYHTTVSWSHATAQSIRYLEVSFINQSGYKTIVDGVQVEVGSTATPFIENFSVGQSNIGTNGVDGNVISWEALIGKHFVDREIRVAGGTDAHLNRILIGNAKQTESFSVLSTAFFRWHAPGMSSTKGWNYTKHVESGTGVFGRTVTFAQPYYSWSGATSTPIMIITPKEVVTYSTVSGAGGTQKLNYNYTASSSGFVANAYLMVSSAIVVNRTFNKGWYRQTFSGLDTAWYNVMSGQQTVASCYRTVSGFTFGSWSTILPTQSKSSVASWSYGVDCKPIAPFIDAMVRVMFYGTSNSSTSFSNVSQWRLINWAYHNFNLGGDSDTGPTSPVIPFQMNLSTSTFKRIKSCVAVIRPVIHYQRAILYPGTLSYQDSFSRVLKSDSAVGTFYYTALDGGVMG